MTDKLFLKILNRPIYGFRWQQQWALYLPKKLASGYRKINPENIEAAQAQATKFFESLTSKKTQAEYEPDLEEITTEEKSLIMLHTKQ